MTKVTFEPSYFNPARHLLIRRPWKRADAPRRYLTDFRVTTDAMSFVNEIAVTEILEAPASRGLATKITRIRTSDL